MCEREGPPIWHIRYILVEVQPWNIVKMGLTSKFAYNTVASKRPDKHRYTLETQIGGVGVPAL